MKNNVNVQKAFTLVELIVVITILAILWTIAFLSMQWYSADARNSKRVSDLNSISNAVSVWSTSWVSIISYTTDTGSVLSTLQLAWTWATPWTDYTAGPINYSVLWIKAEDFQDPLDGTPYVFWATSKIGWKYEVASIKEAGTTESAIILWNYVPRTSTTAIATLTWANVWSWTNSVILSSPNLNKFFVWDTIVTGTSTWKITIVSSDLSKITFDGPAATADTIVLASAEWDWLIDSVTTPGTAVSNWWANLPY